jgi:DNA adenine methylase
MGGLLRFSSRRRGKKVKPYPIGVRDGGATERSMPAEYGGIPGSQFADIAGARYPVDQRHIGPALAYWSKDGNRRFYTEEKQEEITRRIVDAALKHGIDVAYDPGFMKSLPLATKEKLKGFFLQADEKPKPVENAPHPAFPWVGGKFAIRKEIVERMPPHSTYVEPFAGAANVLLAKPPSQGEVINDLDARVVKIHRAIQSRPATWQMSPSAAKWLEIHAKPPSQRSAFEEAYMLANSFGGKGLYYMPRRSQPFDTSKLHDRLEDVIIKNEDFAKVMKRYDSFHTFHYLDPPYVAGHDEYDVTRRNLDNVTPSRVAAVAGAMKGKVMVSYDNDPEVRKAFSRAGWHFGTIRNRRGLQGGNRYVRELLITNYIP